MVPAQLVFAQHRWRQLVREIIEPEGVKPWPQDREFVLETLAE